MKWLSGIALKSLGYERIRQGLWRKGDDEVTYDGCDWGFNGMRVNYVNDII